MGNAIAGMGIGRRPCLSHRLAGPWVALILCVSLGTMAHAEPEPEACRNIVAGLQSQPETKGPLSPQELVRLNDFGSASAALSGPNPMAVSPDGDRAALLLRRADPVSNHYCLGLIVVALRRPAPLRLLDQSDQIIIHSAVNRQFAAFGSGYIDALPPRWSPDGHEIAFLRKGQDGTQIWVVPSAGGPARPVSALGDEIDDFAWARDGKAILFASRPAMAATAEAISNEGFGGWHYDGRFWPLSSSRPLVTFPAPTVVQRIDIATLRLTKASADEQQILDPTQFPGGHPGSILTRVSATNIHAWTVARSEDPFDHTSLLHVDGATVSCGKRCDHVRDFWWLGASTLLYLQLEGEALDQIALYRWDPRHGHPRRILLTDDVLLGCQLSRSRLICAREGSTSPRKLVALDIRSGAQRILFDPNPGVGPRLHPAFRLRWTNDVGLSAFGDVVLPDSYRPGMPLPLIVTTYVSRGFLRGGMGDEYPIQLFANAGFAVLSFDKPEDVASLNPGGTIEEDMRRNFARGANRRSIQSALERGVQILVDRGIADPHRIGITGLSDGASITTFALINSHLFSAAAISTCCEEATTSMMMMGPTYRDEELRRGYPRTVAADPAYWARLSLKASAAEVSTPLLVQASDAEFRMGLETLTDYWAHGRPADLYVFPDEHHIKWQPAHRLAIYRRNIAWFEFWLQGKSDRALASDDELKRWVAMRAGLAAPDQDHALAQSSASVR